MVVDVSKIEKLVNTHFRIRGNFEIDRNTGTVDVNGDIDVTTRIDQFPVTFGTVTGSFVCFNKGLQSLQGSPRVVGDDFDVAHNRLTSLVGSPVEVGGSFNCGYNQLTDLVGSSIKIGTYLHCNGNQLLTLDGLTNTPFDIIYLMYLSHLPLLRTLVAKRIRISTFDKHTQLLSSILDKHAGKGRRGAFSAAREIISAGEQLQKEQGLDHNPFEANARW